MYVIAPFRTLRLKCSSKSNHFVLSEWNCFDPDIIRRWGKDCIVNNIRSKDQTVKMFEVDEIRSRTNV